MADAETEDEWRVKSIEEQVVHKVWKARLHGYGEAAKKFPTLEPKSSEFNKYLGLIKNFVTDSNAVALDKGLDAALAFVENAHSAGKTADAVVSGTIAKVLGSAKKTTKEKGQNLILMFVEIEKQDIVVDELVKGLDNKNPKVVACVLNTLTLAVIEFGTKIVSPKPILKAIPAKLEDRDKNVRDEAKNLSVALYSYIGGAALKPMMQNFKAVLVTELETAFQKQGDVRSTPTRFVRSEQAKREAIMDNANDGAECSAEGDGQTAGAVEDLDPWDLLDPVNVAEKLEKENTEFSKLVASKKWSERKEAYEYLHKLLTDNPKLEFSSQYGEIVSLLKATIAKDANVNVVLVAIQCLEGLASGLRKKFAQFTTICIPVLLEKFKEKKPNVLAALRLAVDAMMKTTTLDVISEDLVKALENKTPGVRSETAEYLCRWFSVSSPAMLPKKLLKVFATALKTAIDDPDKNVRDAAMKALGVAMRVVSEKNIMPFIPDIETIKMEKIKEYCTNAEVKAPSAPAKKVAVTSQEMEKKPPVNNSSKTATTTSARKTPSKTSSKSGPAAKAAKSTVAAAVVEPEPEEDEMDDAGPDDLVSRVDVSEQFTEELLTRLSNSDWKVRLDTLEKCMTIITKAKHVSSDLGAFPEAFKPRLTDSNVKLQNKSLEVAQLLGPAVGPKIKNLIPVLGPSLFAALGTNKVPVRAQTLSALTAWVEQCGLKPFLENEILPESFKSENPFLRADAFSWLSEQLTQAIDKKLPTADLKTCVPILYSSCEDRNPEVRRSAQEAILPFMIHVGYEQMVRMTEKLKAASVSTIIPLLDKARPNVPTKSTGKATASAAESAEPKGVIGSGVKKAAAGRGSRSSSAVRGGSKKPGETAPKRKGEGDADAALIDTNNKQNRLNDEKTMKVLRWQFAAPKAEYIDQLSEQMLSITTPSLQAQLFHSDFRQHLKALDTLVQCVQLYPDASVNSSDLLLKWCTLRFFDTNPSVLNKCLEYIQGLFSLCIERSVMLSEMEANSFVPFLLNKAGDQKDNVREGVKRIVGLLCDLYPASKLFVFLMDATKSKNARQRAECLGQVASLIECFGMDVCQPTSAQALKAVAVFIGDKDNGVRNSALSTCVAAYHHIGDMQLYKYVGNVSDKDLSLLQERIKRAGKPTISMKKPAATTPAKTSGVAGGPSGDSRKTPAGNRGGASGSALVNGRGSPYVNGDDGNVSDCDDPPNKRGMFELDWQEIGPNPITSEAYKPIETPEYSDIYKMIEEPVKVYKIKSKLPKRDATPKPSAASTEASSTLESVISQISSTSISNSVQALAQLDELLKDPSKSSLMSGHVDQFFQAVFFQFRLAYNVHMSDANVPKENVIALYRNLCMTLLSLIQQSDLLQEATEGPLKDLIYNLIMVLLDDRLRAMDDGNQVIRSINVMVVNLVDGCQLGVCVVALIRLLKEAEESACSARFKELVMKCLWKLTRMLGDKVEKDRNIIANKLDQILLDLHHFFVSFPSTYWKGRLKSEDLPLRTIKTVVHTLTKLLGRDMLSYLTLIENPEKSELVLYLKKTIRQLEAEGVLAVSDNNSSDIRGAPGRDGSGTRQTPEKEAAVLLKRIGGTSGSQQDALRDFYNFTKMHPNINIKQVLSNQTEFFQNYVEKNLEQLRKDDANNSSATNNMPTAQRNLNGSSGGGTTDVEACRARLESYRKMMGVQGPIETNFDSNRMQTDGGGPVDINARFQNLIQLRRQMGLDTVEIEKKYDDMRHVASETSSEVELPTPATPARKPNHTSSVTEDVRSETHSADIEALKSRLDQIRGRNVQQKN